MADLSTKELVERLERVPLYRWSGDSEPEYQVSDTPAQAAKRIAELDDQLLDARFIMGAVEAALWNEDATAVALERGRMREWMKRFDAESAS